MAASVVDDTGAAFAVTLTHPTRGTVQVSLLKGGTTGGGSITIGGVTSTLTSTVQAISVTDQGVTWGGAAPAAPPAAPSGVRVTP